MTTIDAEKPETKVGVILGVETHLDDLHVAVAVDHLGREAWASRPKTCRLMGSSKTPFSGIRHNPSLFNCRFLRLRLGPT